MDFFLQTFVLLLVVVDPFGLTPIFSALTSQDSLAGRRNIAIKSVLISAVVLAFFTFAGSLLLDYLGIGMPAFRMAGGILLFMVAIDMLFVRHSGLSSATEEERLEGRERGDVSVFPLAIPLIAGPGALTTVMLVTSDRGLMISIGVLAIVLLVLGITFSMFLLAGRIQRLLGETGINVITRLLGILLAALAMQFFVDGLRESFPSLGGG